MNNNRALAGSINSSMVQLQLGMLNVVSPVHDLRWEAFVLR